MHLGLCRVEISVADDIVLMMPNAVNGAEVGGRRKRGDEAKCERGESKRKVKERKRMHRTPCTPCSRAN